MDPGVARGGGCGVQRQHTDRAEHAERRGRHRQPAPGQSNCGHRRDPVGAEHEVGGAADHREQRPADADRVQRGAGEQVEDEHEPDDAHRRAGERDRGRALAAAQPQPGDDRRRRGVLDQQRRPDRHPRDRREVGELGERHRHRSVEQDEPGVGSQLMPAAAEVDNCERRDDERSQPETYQDDRTGAPPGIEQSARDRAREPERRSGDDRQAQPRVPGSIMTVRAHGK
jgi:hypothetical protein